MGGRGGRRGSRRSSLQLERCWSARGRAGGRVGRLGEGGYGSSHTQLCGAEFKAVCPVCIQRPNTGRKAHTSLRECERLLSFLRHAASARGGWAIGEEEGRSFTHPGMRRRVQGRSLCTHSETKPRAHTLPARGRTRGIAGGVGRCAAVCGTHGDGSPDGEAFRWGAYFPWRCVGRSQRFSVLRRRAEKRTAPLLERRKQGTAHFKAGAKPLNSGGCFAASVGTIAYVCTH